MLYVPSTDLLCQWSHFWNLFKKYTLTPIQLFNYSRMCVCVCVVSFAMWHNGKTKKKGTQHTTLQPNRWAPKPPSPSVESSDMKVKVTGNTWNAGTTYSTIHHKEDRAATNNGDCTAEPCKLKNAFVFWIRLFKGRLKMMIYWMYN